LLVVFVIGAVALGGLVADWWYLRQRVRLAATLFQQNDEQRATIEAFNRRVTELRQEVTGWREMHARVWEAFGPELAPRSRDAGIGGSSATLVERPASSSPVAELDLLTEQIHDQGQSLKALDRLIGKARRALLALPSRWPVRGAVNSEFGRRLSPWTKVEEHHSGIDINAGPGTPVRAPAGGTVVFAGTNGDYGIAVVLDHGQDIRTLYGHLSKLMVQYGQKIERGHVVGLTGNSGRSSGPHLHYEIFVKGQSVNPRAYLWD
jgi:murein DD-endopeptidase MepM/ murein hydrolase activator NlpD